MTIKTYSKNYVVLLMPESHVTVDKIRVIDAWSSNQTMAQAAAMMCEKMQEYHAKHGNDGSITIAQTGKRYWL